MVETRTARSSIMAPILATDLDRTLIPLPPQEPSETPENTVNSGHPIGEESSRLQRSALRRLQQLVDAGSLEILFVTGRHLASILEVIRRESLPVPDWIIGDVGTTVLQRRPDGAYRVMEAYVNHLDRIAGDLRAAEVRCEVDDLDGLVLQESEKQGLHKLSFYCDASEVERLGEDLRRRLVERSVRYRVVASIDPFTNDGLIDLLPIGVDKAAAIRWWAETQGHPAETIIFAGDSGNDFAALTAGYRAVLVGNADPALADRVRRHHDSAGTSDRFYHASGLATAGVWEGLSHFTGIEPVGDSQVEPVGTKPLS